VDDRRAQRLVQLPRDRGDFDGVEPSVRGHRVSPA